MRFQRDKIQVWHRLPVILSLLGLMQGVLLLQSCAQRPALQVSRVDMGQRVSVDGVEYTVLEATWQSSLGDGPGVRLPAHEFLLLRISATNQQDVAHNLATFRLIAGDGTQHGELANGVNVTDWLGLSRKLESKSSRQGIVLFDAPRAVYELQVAGESYDEETGSVALIQIPIRLPGNEPALTNVLE